MNNYSTNGQAHLSPSLGHHPNQSSHDLLAHDLPAPKPGFSRHHPSHTRLTATVAKLYYEERCTQNEIADKLRLSQGTVCRVLQKAEQEGIVRITVIPPDDSFVDLEELLEHKFGLAEVIIARAASDSDESMQSVLGAASALFLESTLKPGEVIGIAPRSATLQSMVEQMPLIWKADACQVVQILGETSASTADEHAHHLVPELAKLVQGQAHLLPAPSLVDSKAAADVLAQDPQIRETMALYERITIALVGIGSVEHSSWQAACENRFSIAELQKLEAKGAVGNICLRFYDARGKEVEDMLDSKVFGLELHRLKSIPSVVGIAGGKSKHQAILGAVRGRWVNVLITDQYSAEALVQA
jgi:DNA-binding transcriptional regulator LsrR (DeoR family)